MEASEYLPTEAETNTRTVQQENRRILEVTSRAYQEAAQDSRLGHGAVRIFMLLTERSWWHNWGGDGKGGITIPIDKIASRTTAKRDSVIRWLRQLAKFEYIWIDKIPQKSGWPVNKYYITCLVPKSDQKELQLSPKTETSPSPKTETSPSPKTETSPSPKVRTSPSPPNGTVKEGTVKNGRYSPPTSAAESKKQTFNGFDLNRLYPHEIESFLDRLNKQIKNFRADPGNWVWELSPEAKAAIQSMRDIARELQTSKKKSDRAKAAQYRADADAMEKDPSQKIKTVLTKSAAATMSNFTRQKETLEAALNCPVTV